MIFRFKKYFKILYIFFVFLSLTLFFFSTDKAEANSFSIDNIEISKPFEINFNKNKVIDEGFEKAFLELVSLITKTSDRNKIKKIKLNEIKSMVETFSIKEEKFIDEIYYLNLGVSFSRKKIFDYLEEKNIFPSIPIKENVILIPVIIDEVKNEVKMFSENSIFNSWNSTRSKFELLNYILPNEDLEDFNLIKKNIKNLESFDFKYIVQKYSISNYIVVIIFKNKNQIKLLNKINFNNQMTLKQIKFNEFDLNNQTEVIKLIEKLKINYENYWKSKNEINTSVKLSLNISIDNSNNININKFEKELSNMDLIYDFNIYKFDNKNNFYKVIFNGTHKKFLEEMKLKNFEFDTKKKIWTVK